MLFPVLGVLCNSIPVYSFDESTATLSVSKCPSLDAECVLDQASFRDSGPYTSYVSIMINFGINELATNVFNDCPMLEEISIPTTVKTISTPFCSNCASLISIKVASGSPFFESDEYGVLYKLGREELFRVPSAIRSIKLYDNLHTIKARAFQGSRLKTVVIPKTVNVIEPGSFYDSYIDSFKFEKGTIITELGSNSLAIQYRIIHLTVPASVQIIHAQVFRSCLRLKEVTFETGSNLTIIRNQVFEYCSSLESIVIPDGVTAIGDNTFLNCPVLHSVHLSTSLSNLSISAFTGCTSLSNLTISADNVNFAIINSSLYRKDLTELFFISPSVTKLVVHDNLTSISSTILQLSPNLIELEISKTHQRFESHKNMIIDKESHILLAFVGGIESIVIPSGIKELSSYCAFMLGKIQSVVIPEGVTSLGQYCFAKSSITSISLPSTLLTVNSYCFSACSSLSSVSFSNKSTISFKEHSFDSCTSLTRVKFNCNVSEIGLQTFKYSSVKTVIFEVEGIKKLGSYSFCYTNQLEEVSFPSSLETISSFSFLSSNIKSILFPNGCSVKTISSSAFQNAQMISSISFGRSLETIEQNAFNGCQRLSSILFDDDCPLSQITASEIFKDCVSLTNLVLPRNVVEIDPTVFSNCINLEEILASPNSLIFTTHKGILYKDGTELAICPQGRSEAEIKDGVTEVCVRCFYRCTNLTRLSFPETSLFTEFSDGMFSGCSSLQEVNIPCLVRNISSGAFSGCSALKTVLISKRSSLQELALACFSGLESLESIQLQMCTSLNSLSDKCFSGCSYLSEICLPVSVRIIGKSCFEGCTALTSLKLPNGSPLEEIQTGAFSGCARLTGVVFPSNLRSIGPSAFKGCRLDPLFIIPSGVDYVGEECFSSSGIRVINYCGKSNLNNPAFGNTLSPPIVHVLSDYPFSVCLGEAPERTLDAECVIMTAYFDSVKAGMGILLSAMASVEE